VQGLVEAGAGLDGGLVAGAVGGEVAGLQQLLLSAAATAVDLVTAAGHVERGGVDLATLRRGEIVAGGVVPKQREKRRRDGRKESERLTAEG
jgi:hypothetical protein